MSQTRTALAVVATLLSLYALNGCNDSNRGKAFPKQATMTVGPLRVYVADSIPIADRPELANTIGLHYNAFNQRVVPAIQFVYPNLPYPTATRDLYIYDTAHLNAPWAANQLGWTDIDKGNRINVVLGHCNLVPDLTHQLAHSYYYPYDVHHQTAVVGSTLIWSTVAQVESDLLTQLKIQRFCPH